MTGVDGVGVLPSVLSPLVVPLPVLSPLVLSPLVVPLLVDGPVDGARPVS